MKWKMKKRNNLDGYKTEKIIVYVSHNSVAVYSYRTVNSELVPQLLYFDITDTYLEVLLFIILNYYMKSKRNLHTLVYN